MSKTLIPIAVGLAVAAAAALATSSLFLAAAWSGIHSGRTDRPGSAEIAVVWVIFLCVAAVPPALGGIAGWATHRAMDRRARARGVD
jgi:hypothetical protein